MDLALTPIAIWMKSTYFEVLPLDVRVVIVSGVYRAPRDHRNGTSYESQSPDS